MADERARAWVERSCAKCPIGAAAGVGAGGRCPMVDRTRRAGTSLYVEGEVAEKIWFVKRGLVSLSRAVDAKGWSGAVWTVRRPGAVLGLEALVRPTYVDSARAVSDVTLCAAPVDTMREWLASRAEAAMAVLGCVVGATCHDTPRRAAADGTAVERVSAWLLDPEAQAQAVGVPRTVVAGLLGMEPETLSRTLTLLAGKGLITVTRRAVAIVDRPKLERVAASGISAAS